MDYEKEIARRDKRMQSYRQSIRELQEEILGLRQLLDCAAANIVLLTKEKGEKVILSKNEVSEALGKYRLSAQCDEEGNYILEILEE